MLTRRATRLSFDSGRGRGTQREQMDQAKVLLRQWHNLSSSDLPQPIRPHARHMATQVAACYGLEQLGSTGTSNGRNLLSVPWRTAHCTAFPQASNSSDGHASLLWEGKGEGDMGAHRGGRWQMALSHRYCDSIDKVAACPIKTTQSMDILLSQPRLNPQEEPRRASPQAAHLIVSHSSSPGALLYLPLELAFVPKQTAASRISISVVHLTSYEGMGIVRIRCGGTCQCDEQRIDGHAASSTRNVSVFVEHTFAATLRHSQACPLLVWLTNESSSGGVKFKVRGLTARAI
ncbi:MAG: hypothetical protein SGPRY_011789 [Prymnesium sp.]